MVVERATLVRTDGAGGSVPAMVEPVVGTVTAADGVEIVFDDAGSGDPALVFVHGWAGNRHHWDGQLDTFAGDHRVVRIDLANHGDSGTGRRQWSITSFADDVVAVVDALGLEHVVLIGHSLGGSVVVAAAQRLGARVDGVVGVDTWSGLGPPPPPDDPAYSIPIPEMRADFGAGAIQFVDLMCGPNADADLIRRITDEVLSMPPDVAVAILGGSGGGFDLAESLRALGVPVSAISSEYFRPKNEAAFASFGITNVMLPGTGHYVMLERPREFDAALAAAIARAT
jgi:pimeloyl-ACP methyl ester carboxylesterase